MIRNCLILGSGRCGTSALAGSLAHSGAYIGLHLVGASPQMPLGYWEDRWINKWNDELIVQADPGYKGLFITPVSLGVDWTKVQVSRPELVRRQFWFTPYALKDPRFAYTYPAWQPFLVQPTVCLVLFRNPSDFVASALRLRLDHSVIESDESALLGMWENAYQHVLANDDGNFYYFEQEQIISGAVLPYLEQLLGYPIDRGFIRPELAHSRPDLACPARLLPLYEQLRCLARRVS